MRPRRQGEQQAEAQRATPNRAQRGRRRRIVVVVGEKSPEMPALRDGLIGERVALVRTLWREHRIQALAIDGYRAWLGMEHRRSRRGKRRADASDDDAGDLANMHESTFV